ncbi:hypothetical protein PHLCEN_2v5132, partial [Hermanssonia centrifuga]
TPTLFRHRLPPSSPSQQQLRQLRQWHPPLLPRHLRSLHALGQLTASLVQRKPARVAVVGNDPYRISLIVAVPWRRVLYNCLSSVQTLSWQIRRQSEHATIATVPFRSNGLRQRSASSVSSSSMSLRRRGLHLTVSSYSRSTRDRS